MKSKNLQADPRAYAQSLNRVPVCRRRMANTDGFPPVDVSDTGEEYLFEFDLPGLKLDDLQISRDDATLYLEGERPTRRCGGQSLRSERPAGVFARRLPQPADACADEIHAILQDGVLELHVPRRLPPDENGRSNIIPFKETHYEHTHS